MSVITCPFLASDIPIDTLRPRLHLWPLPSPAESGGGTDGGGEGRVAASCDQSRPPPDKPPEPVTV